MNSASPLSRSLAPLAGIFWSLFFVTSALVAIVWISGFGVAMQDAASFRRTFANPELRESLILLSRAIDPAWIALGAIAVYLGIVRSEGLALARTWAITIMLTGFVITMISVKTSWPLGPVVYPENLGWRIGAVPFGIPLLWFVIVGGSRETFMRLSPRASHFAVSLGTACLSLLTIANLDPIAWKYRAWWLWYPKPFEGPNHAPIQSYVTWLVASFALAWFMRSTRVAPANEKRLSAPMIVWAILNVVVFSTHLALRIR